MQYFVGGDTPVGEEGIAPDVVVEEPAPSEGELRALLRLRASGAARTYAERLVERDRQRAQRLAESEEGMRADAYPGIGEVAAGVPVEAVRAEVRRELRRRLGGERTVCDPYADAALARAVGMLRRPAEPASESPFHAERLRRVVEFLASPEMRGRGLGTEENARAARWIGERFDALGLDTVVNGHRFHEFDVRGRTLRNVAGILRGPAGARGYVVVAAHHDGLGVRGDEVRPGADDNASGVAAMLAVAEALRADRGALRRHVVFVSFDGEESGLIGSMRFVADGVVPAGQIAFFLVFDVVGGEFLPGDGRIYAMGGEYSAQVGEWVGRCAQRADAPVTPVGTYVIEPFGPLTARSDYLAFRDARVPYLFVSTGTPWYYHTRYDSPERLNYGKISAVARFAYEVVREAATSEVQAEFRTDPPAQVSDARVVLDGVEKVLDGSAGIRPARELREALEEDRAALRAIVERGEVDAAGRRAIQRAMANVFRAVAAYRPEE
jgi:Zn-dependent M28 family amino/carboxypeptidase